MTTLEDAATVLVEKLKTLESHTEQADKAFADLEAALAAVSHQLESDSRALEERVQSFIQHVHEAKARLDQDGQEAGAALKALDDAAEAARSEQETEVQEARGEIQALQQHVGAIDGQARTMLQGVLNAAGNLKTRADETEAQLEQVVAEARRMLQEDLAAGLEQAQDEINQRADELRTTIEEECTRDLQGAYDEFSAAFEEAERLTEDNAFGKAPDHAREVIEAAFRECAEAYRDELEEIVAATVKLEASIHDLNQEVDEVRSDAVDAGKDNLIHRMSDMNDGLGQMEQALNDVKALLARFSFVRM
jgi:DNA repair exonuclease SbcCD ATPase subunit